MFVRMTPASFRRTLVVVVCAAVALSADAVPRRNALDLPPIVTLELQLLEGVPVIVSIPDGRLVTFENVDLDFRVGIVPHVLDATSGKLELQIVQIAGRSGAAQVLERVDTLHGQRGFRSVTAAVGALPLEIAVLQVGAPSPFHASCAASSTSRQEELSPAGPEELRVWGGGCCVTCDGQTTCGCGVSTSCGTCCDCPFC